MNFIHTSSNTLLHRREVRFLHASPSNPGYGAVQKALAEKEGVSDDLVVIKSLTNSYGSSEFLVEAFVYDSAESRQKFEPKPKAKKGGAS